MKLIVNASSKDYANIAAVRKVSFQINSDGIFALLGHGFPVNSPATDLVHGRNAGPDD